MLKNRSVQTSRLLRPTYSGQLWLKRTIARTAHCRGDFHPRGVTMRDCLNNRGGFDRVLMAVAATFLTVSATSAMAQDPARGSAADLAIDAAIPRPEPANVPPPTINDFKRDVTASVPDAAKIDTPKSTEPKIT